RHVAERRRQRVFETAEPEPEGSVPSASRRPPPVRPLPAARVAANGRPTDAHPVGGATAGRIGRARGGGSPLSEAPKGDLEARTGRDLGSVRVHTDAEADRLARGVGANAFTSGADVFFRSGRFSPSTAAGGALLEHEIGHVAGPPA